MLTTLIVCLCLGGSVDAGSISSSIFTSTTVALVDNTQVAITPSSPFDMDEDLDRMATSCLTFQENEQLSGNLIRYRYARGFNNHLIREAADIIAFTEMRAALGFPPPGPWTNYRKPSADELTSTSTIEEYFDLKERSQDRSLDSEYFFEKNFPPVIAFLDKRFPVIRNIYKHKFRQILQGKKERIERKTVDFIIHEYFNNIYEKVNLAIDRMYREKAECRRLSESLQG